jgi:Ni/Co efflux regulator RcnB
MKRTALFAALIVSLAVGPAAFADRDDRDHDRDRDYDRDHPSAHHRHRDRDRHEHSTFDVRPPGYAEYRRPEGYYEHRWMKGERLPRAYHERTYVIDDYRGYRLRSPPRGYHWVRVGGDAVLAAVATGIVLESVFHIFD